MTINSDKDIALMKKDIDYIKTDVAELNGKLDKFIESADKRYAGKTVEVLVYGMVSLVLISFFGTLITLVIQKV